MMSETNENQSPEPVEVSISIGEKLKNIRETKGYSLKYISQQTKISVRILENIESSNFAELPNKTYVTGFVKSYCRILSADADTYIDNFVAEMDADKSKVIKSKSNTNEGQQIGQKQLLTFFGVVLILGVFLGVYKFIKSSSQEVETITEKNSPDVLLESINASTPLAKESNSELTQKPSVTTESANTEEQTAEDKKDEPKVEPAPIEKKPEAIAAAPDQTELIKQKKSDDQTLEVKEEAKKEEVTKVETKEPIKKEEPKKEVVKTKDTIVKTEEKKSEVKKEDKKEKTVQFSEFQLPLYKFDTVDIDDIPLEDLPLTYRQSVLKGKQNIFINATDGDTWITYKADENKVKKFILKEGRRLLIRGELVRIFMGNVKATKMFLNNRPLIIETTSGVRSIVFPQELASNYQIPLFIYKKDGTAQTSDEYQKDLADEE